MDNFLVMLYDNRDLFGVIVATVFLLVAVFFLPKKIRWYVFTGGLAVIGYRIWQITYNRKRLAEADAQRKVLQGEHKALQGELNEHKEELSKLYKELDDVRNERKALVDEAVDLKNKKGEFEKEHDRLNARTKDVVERNNELIRKVEARESAVSAFDELRNAIGEMDTAHRVD